MEEYIKILEEIVETYRSCSVNEEGFDMKVDIGFMKKECEALESLLTKYKEYDSLLGEIDSKEASDALHMLLHCALKDTDFETQKQQFEIVNAYIKQLEEENKSKQKAYDDCYCEYKHYKQFDSIPTSLIKEKIDDFKRCGGSNGRDETENLIRGILIEVLQELLGEE